MRDLRGPCAGAPMIVIRVDFSYETTQLKTSWEDSSSRLKINERGVSSVAATNSQAK